MARFGRQCRSRSPSGSCANTLTLGKAAKKRLLEFPLEAGGSIVIEVDEPEPERCTVRAGRTGEIAALQRVRR